MALDKKGSTETQRQLVYKTSLWLASDRTVMPGTHRWLVNKTSLWLSPDRTGVPEAHKGDIPNSPFTPNSPFLCVRHLTGLGGATNTESLWSATVAGTKRNAVYHTMLVGRGGIYI